ncbi:MAG: hypothetical protein ACYS0I_05285 [Planctomycetota bacterium]|jgi:hypothetical protein
MIAHNSNSLCRQAQIYYYDFLQEESHRLIPVSIINHIEQCQHCQVKINKLKVVLSQAEDNLKWEQRQASSAITTILKLHFEYVGKPVTCEVVKPFLPSLLDPTLEIKIPTPITAHLINCRQCCEDLETIRKLNINRKQMWRLGQLLADKSAEDPVSCESAWSAIMRIVAMDWSGIAAEVLKHFCTCPVCRELIYKKRQKVCESRLGYERSKEFSCESVSPTDIFDYCFPYGIDPNKDEYAKFRPALISHVGQCPTCLAKMQKLHKTIGAIIERSDSEAVTVYQIDESTRVEELTESDDIYAGFPVRVEVIRRGDEVKVEKLASTIDFRTGLRQKTRAMNVKLLVKAGVAAAVILIAVALLFSTPTAEAVTIDKIYKALERVRNVYIFKSVPDKAELVEQRWVSRTLNIYLSKTGEQLVLWDIPNGLRKSKQLNAAVTDTSQLTDDILADVEKKISGSFGLMPFYDISDVPENAKWSCVTGDGPEVTDDIEVYDLSWDEKAYDGSLVFFNWRVFVDIGTNLPQRTELYQTLTPDGEYTLKMTMAVKYLSDSEIQAVIEGSSF